MPPGEGRWPPLVVLCGPTASGKTVLSLRLAAALAGEGWPVEILSADSRQVYRGMDLGTAKVGAAERAAVAHHGLDLVDPDAPFTAAHFQAEAARVLPGIAARGAVCLLVGGTGLYLRSVARGLPLDTGLADPSLRAGLEARLSAEGLAPLAAELQVTAPTLAAATDLANPRRVVRALERARLAGDRLPEPPRGYPGPVVWLGLAVGRDELRARIMARAREQFERGLVAEAVGLRQRFGVHPRAFSAFGYYEALDHADGRLSLEEAMAGDVRRTSAYARRQMTWFRSESGITWLDGADGAADALPVALPRARAVLAADGRSGSGRRAVGA
ncbi:MAG TPA: tRNA (adenosine(37)-N6)-dimethylallyltransferase MiaA [Candidatus Limnocylindrales bacterium]|nr:tRNA (adenosine(37)-N6)-dimethylallyltransferase MiaA [Candidatus Limnocylindrales bacterium]